MRKILLLIMIGLLCFSTFSAFTTQVQAAVENLLSNSGFEDGLTDWIISPGSATYATDISTKISGSFSVKGIELFRGSLGKLSQDVTQEVIPWRQYQISGWIKTQDVTGGGGAAIGLTWVDSIGYTPADGHIPGATIGLVRGTTEWTFYQSAIFTVPPRPTDCVALYFSLDFSDAAGTSWWDDLSLIGTAPPPSYRMLIDEGHSEWLVSSNAQTLIQALEDNDYAIDAFSGTITQSLLSIYDIFLIGTAWSSFTQSEMQAIEDFVKSGGGLWLIGLGWSWVDYHPGVPIEDYPMNKIAQRFGAFFNPDIIFDPTDYTNVPGSAIFHSPFIESHRVTKGVTKIGATGVLHGSISIQTGTILITGDDDSYGGYHESPYPDPGSYPPNCAAIKCGSGKMIVISQEGFFVDAHIDEYDNKILGLNIVEWLVTPLVTATVDFEHWNRGKWVPAYVELPESLSVSDIDVSTVKLNNTISVGKPSEVGDYDNDEIPDLMVKFDRAGLLNWLDAIGWPQRGGYYFVTLTIEGELTDGKYFEGSEFVQLFIKSK